MTDVPHVTGRGEGFGARVSASAVALAIMALGTFVVFDTATDLTGPGYAQVGPGVFPVIVGVALLLAGGALLVQAVRGEWRTAWVERDTPSPTHSRTSERLSVALVAAALVLNVLLFAPLGFIAASAVLFVCVSAAFGSRRLVIDALLGIVFSAAIYVAFVHGLGLNLPAGDLWEGMPWTR